MENKKKYVVPNMELLHIEFSEEVLTSSMPGAGDWGYVDEETLPSDIGTGDDNFEW